MNATNLQRAAFVLDGTRCQVEFEVRPAQLQEGGRTIDLEPIQEGEVEIALTGDIDGASGQIVDQLRDAGEEYPEVARLCDLWNRWHLNGMKAGTRKQLEYLEECEVHGYDDCVTALKEGGLLVDNGYTYGTAWLFEPVPGEVIGEIAAILDSLRGKRFGEAPSVDDAPELGGDVIDSRDVIKRLEIYREAAAGIQDDTEDDDEREILEELAALEELESEASGCGDWQYGATLIRESYFEEYAKQLADDIGAIDSDAKWPACHIDWAAAADALKADYSEVTYRGETYFIRD